MKEERSLKEVLTEIKKIKEKLEIANKERWTLERKLELLKEERKKVCPHPAEKIMERENSFQDYPMTSPVRWEERYCKACGKVLETRGEKIEKTKWHKVKDEL